MKKWLMTLIFRKEIKEYEEMIEYYIKELEELVQMIDLYDDEVNLLERKLMISDVMITAMAKYLYRR